MHTHTQQHVSFQVAMTTRSILISAHECLNEEEEISLQLKIFYISLEDRTMQLSVSERSSHFHACHQTTETHSHIHSSVI